MGHQHKTAVLTSVVLLLVVILCVTIFISLFFGSSFIPPKDTLKTLLDSLFNPGNAESAEAMVLLQIRLPRILLAALVGMILSLAGVMLQGILKNPLADPYILGISAGGGVGAALAITLGLEFTLWGMSGIPIFAFIFSVAAVLVVYRLSNVGGRTTTETLILSGVAVSAFCAAALSLLIIISGELQSIYFWLLGSLAAAHWGQVTTLLPYAMLGILVAYYFSKDLNALLLGDESAQTLGVSVERTRIFLIVVASLITAAAVSVAGLIGFVGLIVPHIIRIFIGPQHRFLVPLSALSGMILMIIADIFARVLMSPMEIPIGVIMSILGAPFFLYLVRHRHRRGLIR
jgi:iron complex transport system permease protein